MRRVHDRPSRSDVSAGLSGGLPMLVFLLPRGCIRSCPDRYDGRVQGEKSDCHASLSDNLVPDRSDWILLSYDLMSGH